MATRDKGHGRLDLRTLERGAALITSLTWPGVGRVLRSSCQRVVRATGVITEEIACEVTNLSPGNASAAWVEAVWRETGPSRTASTTSAM